MYAHGSSVHQKCSNYALTNLLFGLCKFVWIIDPLFTRPNPHPKIPTWPFYVTTLALGSGLKQGLQECRTRRRPRRHILLPRMQKSGRKWTLTLPRQLSLGELESIRTPKSLRSNCKGQNPLDWRVFYTIGKILKLKCQKWAHITHLDI